MIAYQKRDLTDQHIIDTISLDLPEQTFTTQAFWLAIPEQTIDAALAALAEADAATADDAMATPGSSTPPSTRSSPCCRCTPCATAGTSAASAPPGTGRPIRPSIFVYDGYPGGIGLARRGYEAFESLAADARALIAECPCESGCPSCVQSPKCGNLNEPLSKAGAVALLEAMGRQA